MVLLTKWSRMFDPAWALGFAPGMPVTVIRTDQVHKMPCQACDEPPTGFEPMTSPLRKGRSAN